MKVPKEDFVALHDEIVAKFIASDLKHLTKERQYGFGKSGSEEAYSLSLKVAIENNEDVISFLDQMETISKRRPPINGKHLYLKYEEAKSSEGEYINLTGIYKYIYFICLGYKDYDAFAQHLADGVPYTVYYYSQKRHEVRTYNLSINYDLSPYRVKEWGFHDSDLGIMHYSGNGHIISNNLHIHLSSGREHELEIIIFTGLNENNSPKHRDVLSGIMLGISINAKTPIAIEIVLVKTSVVDIWGLTIQRYLMLKRNCFVGNNEPFEKPEFLEATKGLVSKIEHMVGTWRIWAYSRETKCVLQSKFVINKDYTAVLYTPPLHAGENIFTCFLNTHSAVNEELCVSAHPRNSLDIMYYTIIDIPPKNSKYTEGVFSSVGQEHNPSKCSNIALYRDDSSFEGEILKLEHVDNLIQLNGDLRNLKHKLLN